jgi:hypothetical protein
MVDPVFLKQGFQPGNLGVAGVALRPAAYFKNEVVGGAGVVGHRRSPGL